MKYLITVPSLCVSLVLLFALQAAPIGASSYPVSAVLAGVEFRTTVDSASARQIISGTGDDLSPAEVDSLNARLTCLSRYQLPDVNTLQQISNDYSPDTATALLARCLFSMPQIQLSQNLFLAELSRQRASDEGQAAYLKANSNQYLVLFVPGWGYLSNSDETGSDMAGPRERIASLGFETKLVPLEENGSVERNADILVETVRMHLQSNKKIILASASSGGPTVALALTDPAIGNHPQLQGWLNICGVLRGSPVIDYFTPWPKSWLLRIVALFEGWDYQNLMSLSRASSQQRFAEFVAPEHLTIINYVGIPFSGQLSRFGKEFYGLLKSTGPNDGLTFITDALAPGYTVMAVGTDHFVNEDPDIGQKTAALLPVMLQLIARDNELLAGLH